MKDWRQIKIGDLGRVVTGNTPPRANPAFYGTHTIFVKPTDIEENTRFTKNPEESYSELGYKQYINSLIPKGATCVVTIGSIGKKLTLAHCDMFINQAMNAVICNESYDANFVFYLLKKNLNSVKLIDSGTASGRENVSKSAFSNIELMVPTSLQVQRKIAAILSAYDDLIENNNRRIAILEKMAEELYREWFVRLRFPGHEGVKIVKGVPEGWEVKKIGEVIEYYIGGGWGEENQDSVFSEGAYVIRGTDIPKIQSGKFEQPPYRFHKKSNYESRKIKVGDIVFEVSGGSTNQLLGRSLLVTDGILKFCEGKVICASFCKLIRPSISPYFLSHFLKAYYASDLVSTFQIQSTGISNYQFEAFVRYQVIPVPANGLLDRFEEIVRNFNTEKDMLAQKNVFLQTSRDRLLSRLMSGKIDVEKLDIAFPESMEEAGASTGSATATDFTAKKTSSVTEPVGEPVEPVEAPAK